MAERLEREGGPWAGLYLQGLTGNQGDAAPANPRERELADDGLATLLVQPLRMRAREIDDPVLRDALCLSRAVTHCRRRDAVARLELDLLRERGALPRVVDPDPGRRDSPWFRIRREDHQEDGQDAPVPVVVTDDFEPVIPAPRLHRVRAGEDARRELRGMYRQMLRRNPGLRNSPWFDTYAEGLISGPGEQLVPDKDPVLWDEACTQGLNPGCNVEAAARRLRNDELHYGLGGLLLPHPQPWRARSEGYRDNEREWQAEQRRAREREEEEEALSFGDQLVGFGKGVGDWGKGLWDTGVRSYRSVSLTLCAPTSRPGPSSCKTLRMPGVSEEEGERAAQETIDGYEYIVEHPDEAALAYINWDDLSHGRYGEWLGSFGPDVVITVVSGGGGAVTKVIRVGDTDVPTRSLDRGGRDGDSPSPTRLGTDRAHGQTELPPSVLVEAVLDSLPPAIRRRIDSSAASRAALEDIFSRTSSYRFTPRDGKAHPTRIRGAASELRVLYDWTRRGYVRRISLIRPSGGSRTPDFVVTLRDGRNVRVEVTSVSVGGGSGYRKRGFGRSRAVDARNVAGAIDRKIKGSRTQFNSALAGVPTGGILSLHLRGPAGAAADAADTAVGSRLRALRAADVRVVEVSLGDRRVVRYTLTPSGELRRRVVLDPARH
jgi:hypothetical protein